MGFIEAVKIGLSNYCTFSGRASRSEYWYMVLFSFLFQIVAYSLCGFVGYLYGDIVGLAWGIIIGNIVSTLFLFIPMLAVTIRRLHDTNHSGWWYFIGLILIVGWIWLLVLMLQESDDENQYGPPIY